MALFDGTRWLAVGILLEVEYLNREAGYTILVGALQPWLRQNNGLTESCLLARLYAHGG